MPDYAQKVALMLERAGFNPARLAGKTQDQAIALLLAAAEDADSTVEAQSCTAVAARWMAEKSITAAMIAAGKQDASPRVATHDQLGPMGRPFQHQRKDLACAIGRALRLHPVINHLPSSQPGKYREDIAVTLVGAAGDLARAKTLFTSTMLQGLHVMSCELPKGAGSSQKQSWLQGWAAGVGHVLDLAEKNAARSYDQEHKLEAGHRATDLVLADWDVIVLRYQATLFGTLGPARSRSTSGNRFRDGFTAGTQADIGRAGVGQAGRPVAGVLG
jgi:hypothetical protein